jgi:hypothetical protein
MYWSPIIIEGRNITPTQKITKIKIGTGYQLSSDMKLNHRMKGLFYLLMAIVNISPSLLPYVSHI